jgi:polar amino acid transport system substrate-binding protein
MYVHGTIIKSVVRLSQPISKTRAVRYYSRGAHSMEKVVCAVKRVRPTPLAAIMFLIIAVLDLSAGDSPLRVAYKTDSPFYQFTDERGTAAGVHIDLMNAIARDAALAIEYVPMQKLWDCINALESGDVDLVLGVPSSEEGPFISSMETMTATICILSSKEILPARNPDMRSSYTAVLEYNTTNISLLSNIAATTYIVTGSQKELLQKHLAGQGDFMICDLNCMMYLLKQAGIKDSFSLVQGNIGTVGYVTAVRKGNLTLLRLINDGLMKLRVSGEYDRIRTEWIPQEPDPKIQIASIIRTVLMGAVITSLGIVIFILTSTRIRNHLKKEVREKTQELHLRINQLQSESELRNRIIERSPNGIVLFGRDGLVRLANSSACGIMGLQKPPVGEDVMTLPIFGDILAKHAGQGFAGEDQVTNTIHSVIRRNGLRDLYQYSILPIMEGGQCGSALLTVEDITVDEEKKQAVIEKKKNETLNLMLAGIAHEIKNPLTGIRNFATLIKTKREDKQFLDYFSLLVPQEVDRINRLVESMMRYACPPRGNPERIDLSLVAGECAYMVGTTIKREGIDVVTDLPKGLFIEVDRDQINQVLINIMLNGVASMERKLQENASCGRLNLHVSSSVHEDFVVLAIRDDGEGMLPQTLQYCTELFYTSKSSGSGIGLALSKQLIQENNGSLNIESEESRGTRITLQFRRSVA